MKKVSFDGDKIMFKKRFWHNECFNCSKCNRNLSNKRFTSSDTNILCISCSEAKQTNKCTGCSQSITSGSVSYQGLSWHPLCFTCFNCKQPLAGNSFTSRHRKVFCLECSDKVFSKQCTGCRKTIRGLFIGL